MAGIAGETDDREMQRLGIRTATQWTADRLRAVQSGLSSRKEGACRYSANDGSSTKRAKERKTGNANGLERESLGPVRSKAKRHTSETAGRNGTVDRSLRDGAERKRIGRRGSRPLGPEASQSGREAGVMGGADRGAAAAAAVVQGEIGRHAGAAGGGRNARAFRRTESRLAAPRMD
ncbi:hypothetical protein CMQ_6684 [Grosmannia clavigera kw1407]|uniref:Uncharacterized protein n=1 Tax=Grosmannia clavigera (strain kw1407 / UAMH 11150) TaxID=655863 RepID=F0X7J1_GROCL|nr:uncharacterized protein CMQ_6684 [Grosmannia clavigera kw1407]EFX06363.1 hypothetical protein CMQ_6684 [Grosmannia clavigera kw1407]